MKKLTRLALRLIEYFLHQKEISNPKIVIPILAGTSAGLYVVHNFSDIQTPQWNLQTIGIILALLTCFAVIGVLSWATFVNRRRIFGKAFLPKPETLRGTAERLRIVPIRSEDLLRKLQRDLVHEIFGGATPADLTVVDMFKKNNRKSIGLFSDDDQEFVGFATVWPLTEQAAKDIREGVRDETRITAEDLLPATENFNARFCLIVAVGVKDAETKRGKQRAVKIIQGFKRFFLKEYIGPAASPKTLLAIAEPDGEKWCEYFGMKCENIVESFNGKRPLYIREFAADEIEDTIERLLG